MLFIIALMYIIPVALILYGVYLIGWKYPYKGKRLFSNTENEK